MWLLYAGSLAVIALVLASALRPEHLPAEDFSLCVLVPDRPDQVEGLCGAALSLAGPLRRLIRDVVVVGPEGPAIEILVRLARRHPAINISTLRPDTGRGPEALDAVGAGRWLLVVGLQARGRTPGERALP